MLNARCQILKVLYEELKQLELEEPKGSWKVQGPEEKMMLDKNFLQHRECLNVKKKRKRECIDKVLMMKK